MSQDSTTTADPLDMALVRLNQDGWQLQARSPMAMQLVRPKRFKPSEGWLLAGACIVLVLLLGVVGILIAVLLVIGDLVWYAARSDEHRLVTLASLGTAQRMRPAPIRHPQPPPAPSDWAAHSRSVGACTVCGTLLGGKGRCPRCGTKA